MNYWTERANLLIEKHDGRISYGFDRAQLAADRELIRAVRSKYTTTGKKQRKRCRRCREIHPIGRFEIVLSNQDGRSTVCETCRIQ